ncbi:MAG: FAD-dependent oxidoreductase [Caldilineaceae bacterium]|nr:FAD-dependent oxidoreductase [Caldilineaceae bacterium]
MAKYDVAIVGGGPAGLVAARYAQHARLRVAMVTPSLGGKVNYSFALRGMKPIDTVWGANLVHRFEKVIKAKLDDHFALEAVKIERREDGFEVMMGGGKRIEARAVILTTGASARRLYIAGEKEYWGRGLSFSAISHAPLFAGRDVAVVGGGERALLATLELAPIAKRVYLVAAHPQRMAELPIAEQVAKHSNVVTFQNWEVQQILGDDFVTGISLVGVNGEIRQIPVEGVFIQFALVPSNEMVRDLVDLDRDGHVIVNHRCETSVPGLFAAGDVTSVHAEQVPVAIGEGAKAALSAWEYLSTHP